MRALAAHLWAGQRRGRQPVERAAQRQIIEHLLAVVGVDDDRLGRCLADPRRSRLAARHGDRAVVVVKLDHAFEHDERGLVAVDGQCPVGAANGRRGSRRLDGDAFLAAFGATPDRALLEAEHRVLGAADLLHHHGGVAAEADLGVVDEEDGEVAVGVGAQRVADQQLLGDVDAAPAVNVDEARLLARLPRDHRGSGRRQARKDVCRRRHRASQHRKRGNACSKSSHDDI